MRTFGLIGYPLSHSFSQKYFTEKFRRENIAGCEFRNFSFENINDFPSIVKQNPSLCGLSVTIPHKQTVIKFLDEVDAAAREIGAVNCIKIANDQKLTGYNTDAVGFERSLQPLLKAQHTKALVLGTGGASKAIACVLKKLRIDLLFVSRKKGQGPGTLSYAELNKEIISSHKLIINTSPVGMFPNTNDCPDIPYEFITPQHLLYDLTYNPEETLFLKKGKEKGAAVKNGLEMLHLQAEEAWKIWTTPRP